MKKLREGFTTGSCAAACALASCLWQKTGECPGNVQIIVPAGRSYAPDIHPQGPYRCAVWKDSGDDPDITNHCEVWAEVTLSEQDGPVRFAAGEGVGVITRAGLKLPVGEPAINPVPREVITKAVRSVYPTQAALVTVGITGGRELAKKTFNPRLGIEGGLSVLGTSGIVHPMSDEAMVEAIRLELQMHRAAGVETIGFVFGSQGENALHALSPELPTIQISNFVGASLDMAAELGFERILLAGQAGKLVKVACGSMQTHSKYGDGRRETLCAHLALLGAPVSLIETVMDSVTLDGLIPVIQEQGYAEVWYSLCRNAAIYAEGRVHGALTVDTIMLDGSGQVLGAYLQE